MLGGSVPTFPLKMEKGFNWYFLPLRQQEQPLSDYYRSHLKFQPDNGGTIPNASYIFITRVEAVSPP